MTGAQTAPGAATVEADKPPPVACRWTGEAFEPLRNFRALADRHFVIGETYAMEVFEARSMRSHRHYFACINEAWKNLPDAMRDEHFPTPEHLRKKALIKAGYRDERTIQCASRTEALRVAAFIRPIDDFAVAVTHGASVTILTAKSQSVKAMGAKAFQASKDATLAIVAEMIGVETGALAAAADVGAAKQLEAA